MQFAPKNFHKKFLGHAGEVKAVKFLKKQGYKIIETNRKSHFGEIDIVAADGNELVFVEVKTRTTDKFGAPSQAVDYNKQRKYILMAEEFLLELDDPDTFCRFDVIEVLDGQINHIKNAFVK